MLSEQPFHGYKAQNESESQNSPLVEDVQLIDDTL